MLAADQLLLYFPCYLDIEQAEAIAIITARSSQYIATLANLLLLLYIAAGVVCVDDFATSRGSMVDCGILRCLPWIHATKIQLDA